MSKVTHGSKKKSGWDTRRKAVSVVAAVMALLILVPLVMEIFQYASAVTLDDISSLSNQQAALEGKKDDLQTQLDGLKDQESSAASRCKLLSEKITVLEDEIATTQSLVENYAVQVKTHQKQLKAAKRQEADYYDLFCQRVRSMEEDGSASYWQILFGASGFSDFLDRVSFVSSVMSYDDQVLEQLTQAKKMVAGETKALKEQKEAKQTALKALEEQKSQMKTASTEAAETLKKIKSNQKEYAEQLSAVDTQADELAADIVGAKSDYAAEQKAAREQVAKEQAEAAKKAAESKKVTKEKAAKEKSKVTNKSSTASNDKQKKQTKTEQKSTAKKNTAKVQEEQTTTSTETSASGAAVVTYAMQFVGGRYVWGGSNLSTGVDCSGFVMCVYAHFGRSLPHSSAALASCGKGVSYADARMGDVICYKGHCGIYIGGGKMVNALGVKYGIVVNNVNTGRLVAVRRIV